MCRGEFGGELSDPFVHSISDPSLDPKPYSDVSLYPNLIPIFPSTSLTAIFDVPEINHARRRGPGRCSTGVRGRTPVGEGAGRYGYGRNPAARSSTNHLFSKRQKHRHLPSRRRRGSTIRKCSSFLLLVLTERRYAPPHNQPEKQHRLTDHLDILRILKH